MKAVTYQNFGPAEEVLHYKEMPTPTPMAGEVLVRIHASGVNPSDIRARAGGRPGVTKPPFPEIIPHSDGAGVIEAVGADVPTNRVGQRVWLWNGQWQRAFGTAADYIALPAEQAVPLPDSISYEQGAVLGIPGLTACHAVLGHAVLGAGDSIEGKNILISGGAGTVGHLAVQIATAYGANVMATAGGKDKCAEARQAGASHVFDYRSGDLSEEIMEATKGAPIDQIIEVEFGKNIEMNSALIAPGGTITAYGSAQDMTPTLPFYPLMFKAVNINLILVYLLSPAQRTTAIKHLTRLLEKNALNLRISAQLPLSDCAKAHQLIENNQRNGSVILTNY